MRHLFPTDKPILSRPSQCMQVLPVTVSDTSPEYDDTGPMWQLLVSLALLQEHAHAVRNAGIATHKELGVIALPCAQFKLSPRDRASRLLSHRMAHSSRSVLSALTMTSNVACAPGQTLPLQSWRRRPIWQVHCPVCTPQLPPDGQLQLPGQCRYWQRSP